MPKIVDHDAHRTELANRAAAYFSAHGYAGGSMRKIAEFLGVSKSALYHYFPTKEALFLASTKQVMSRVDGDLLLDEGDEAARIQHLVEVMSKDFGSEMALVFEYLRGKSQDEIKNDEAMRISIAVYRNIVERIVGADRVDETLAMIMGTLMLNYLSAGTWNMESTG